MIYHVVALDDWLAVPDRPGCSPGRLYPLFLRRGRYPRRRQRLLPRHPGPLMVLLIDEHKLDVIVRWETASSVPPGVAPDILLPHVYGRVNRDAVEGMMEVQRDADGRPVGLAVWS